MQTGGSAKSTDRASQALQVYLNGAFLTGVNLEPSALLATSYGAAQRKVKNELERSRHLDWDLKAPTEQPTRERYTLDGTRPSLVPLTFATREGHALRAEVDGGIQRAVKVAQVDPAVEICVAATKLAFYYFGVGVLGVWLNVRPTEPLRIDETRRIVEALTPVAYGHLDHVVARDARAFSDACTGALGADATRPWFGAGSSVGNLDADAVADDARPSVGTVEANTRAASRLAQGLTEPGHLVWVHRTYLLSAAAWGEEARNVARLLPSTSAAQDLQTLTFLPGLGSSAMIWHEDSALGPVGLTTVDGIVEVMDLQWAYIAAAQEIDRTLLRGLAIFRSRAHERTPRTLTAQASDILALAEQVRLFQGTVSSILIDLGGGSQRTWDVMATLQSIPETHQAVETKLAALQEACDKSLVKVSAHQRERLARAVDAFAAFGVVASVGSISAFIGARNLGLTSLQRAGILLLAVVVVLAVLIASALARRETML